MSGLVWGSLAAVGLMLILSSQPLAIRQSLLVGHWRRLAIHLSDLLFAGLASLVTLLFQVPVLALITFVAITAGLRQRRISRAHALYLQRSEAWPDAIDFLISSIRAGMPIGSAIIALADEGPEPLRPVLLSAQQSLLAGGSTPDAIALIRAHADDPIADRICLILEISQGVGGTALGSVLRSLSSYVRSEARTRSELISRQAWTINAAKLAVFAPWVIVLLLSIRAHDAYATPMGSTLLLVGSVATSLGYGWMRRAARLPIAARLA